MSQDSLKFGTSGLRGLAVELEGPAARRYTSAFLRHLRSIDQLGGGKVFLARDFRYSSPIIIADCAAAIAHAGLVAVDCGTIPTPALAYHAMASGCASIMVTGSHIPFDRNGLKFYGPNGEISKADEAGILANLRDDMIPDAVPPEQDELGARQRYVERFALLLPVGALAGLRIGVFEHSSVARDILVDVLQHAGAETVSLGRTDTFVAVDTEAFGDAVFQPLKGWIESEGLDAIVSADGDGDRPLLMDRAGDFVRGDVLGLLAARFLAAQTVVTPVTSNSAIERTGYFDQVVRTKVGSPFVVAAMERAQGGVVGFEANGGTFVGPGIAVSGQDFAPLPTRDAVLPVLCALGLASATGKRVDEIVAALPLQHALADRLQDIPSEKSGTFLRRLQDDPAFAAALFGDHGISSLSSVDGLQFRTTSGDMVHFRASGNAPELRCYVEGSSPAVARALLDWSMRVAAAQVA